MDVSRKVGIYFAQVVPTFCDPGLRRESDPYVLFTVLLVLTYKAFLLSDVVQCSPRSPTSARGVSLLYCYEVPNRLDCKGGSGMTRSLSAIIWILLLTCLGCQHKSAPGTTPPLKVTHPPELWFSDSDYPPVVQGGRFVTMLPPGRAVAGSLNEDDGEDRVLDLCMRDARVRQALGERFAFLGVSEVTFDSARASAAEFYSYTHAGVVRARLQDGRVASVQSLPGLMPQLGDEEAQTAVNLAARDPRISKRIENLEAGTMLVVPTGEEPWAGHRVVHVTFATHVGMQPQRWALVDLTDSKVLNAHIGEVKAR